MNCSKPFLASLIRRLFFLLPAIIWVTNLFFDLSTSYSADVQNGQKRSGDDAVFIYQIAPDKRGGKAYKLVYLVRAPIDSCWKFKTDFNNDFLVKNKYILEHRFILQNGNTAITEDKYTNSPDVYFRWQTTVVPEAHRLDFVLLNPEQCKQKYHYGHIQLESVSEGTRITQVAYFDFGGASLWANYPWRGGMKDFLSYTAHWEQETIMHLKDKYETENPK
jgi:hypothetical protein